jgi:hypothetical protein
MRKKRNLRTMMNHPTLDDHLRGLDWESGVAINHQLDKTLHPYPNFQEVQFQDAQAVLKMGVEIEITINQKLQQLQLSPSTREQRR